MSNKGITIWLILLTTYIGYTEFGLFAHQEKQNSNLEIRSQRFENIDTRFKSLETYLNENLKPNIVARFEHNEKYLHSH